MTAVLPLKYGLTARLVTKKELAAQKRAEVRRKAQRDDAQLELEPPQEHEK
jgi:hypothetical protein